MPELVNFAKPDPDAKIIAELEKALEEAKAGEWHSIVMVKVRANGSFLTRAVGSEGGATRLTVGALAFAMHDIVSDPGHFQEV